MPVFTRRMPDGFHMSADCLLGSYAGVNRTACVILGSGPSATVLNSEVHDRLYDTDFTVFGINWGGKGEVWNIYPNLWTSYDPCTRFSAKLFLDPAVVKFVRKDRENEYIQGERIQAHECPNVYFMEIGCKEYGNFFGEGQIVNSKDSMLQAIDVAIRLGFKDIYLSGADMHVKLSPQQEEFVKKYWPQYLDCDPENSLYETLKALSETAEFKADFPDIVNGLTTAVQEMTKMETAPVYSFGNAGCDFGRSIMVDHHCRLVTTWLRRSRRCLDRLGVSVKLLQPQEGPFQSRLSQVFPVVTVADIPQRELNQKIDYSKCHIEPARDEPPYSIPKTVEKNS